MKTFLRLSPRAAATALALLAAATLAHARQPPPPPQVRLPQASPQATLTETVGVTDLTISYHRPSVRGRVVWGDVPAEKLSSLRNAGTGEPVTGEMTLDGVPGSGKDLPLAPNGHVWRAGANEATTFAVTDDVLVEGRPLKAGTYSLHMIPGRDEWTVVFNRAADLWGSFRYDAKQDALRVKVKPAWVAESRELLTYEVPQATASTARVVLRWEKVAVPFTVEVPAQEALVRSKIEAAVAAAPGDWRVPLAVGNAYFADGKYDEAMKWVEQSVKLKETFQNLRAKTNVLLGMEKMQEAFAVAERAVARGKAEGVDTSRFEKAIADLKARGM